MADEKLLTDAIMRLVERVGKLEDAIENLPQFNYCPVCGAELKRGLR